MLLKMFAQKLAAFRVPLRKKTGTFPSGVQHFIVKTLPTPDEQIINMYRYQPLKLSRVLQQCL